MSEEINTRFEEYWNSLATDPSDSEELVMHCKFAAKHAWIAAAPAPPAQEPIGMGPVAWMHNHVSRYDVMHDAAKQLWLNAYPKQVEYYTLPLYSAEQLATLQAKLEQAEKDAARYRWLRIGDFDIFGHPHAVDLDGEALDRAVDEAIAVGQYEFPRLQWKSADHSLRVKLETDLYTAEQLATLQDLLTRSGHVTEQYRGQLAVLQAKLDQAEKDEARYAARRKSAFLVSIGMQIGGARRTECEFNIEYDITSDNNIAGYVVDHRGVFVKDEAMTLAKYEVKK